MRESSFRPSRHGWPFANGFRLPPHLLGLNRPLPETFGLCGGMCWAALDRFLAGRRVPRPLDAPVPGDPLHAELVLRQANVLARGVWDRVVDWQRRPDRGRVFGTAGVAALTRRELRGLRGRLDAGEPVLVCVAGDAGAFTAPTESHQVLAYRYARDAGARRIRIWVYDPNHPDDDDRKLVVTLGYGGRPRDAMLDGYGRVRGLFVVPYDRPRPIEVMAETFADRSRVTLNHALLDSPTVIAGDGGRIDIFGRDEHAELIHFRRGRDGIWVHDDLTRRRGIGPDFRVYGRPAVSAGPRESLSVFARSYAGDVIVYRRSRGRGWRARNLTDTRRIGLRFRITDDPIALAGPGRRQSVFARDREGHLLHYEWTPVTGWSATDLTGAFARAGTYALRTAPVVVAGSDGVQHVFGGNAAGELVHYRRSGDGPWSAAIVPAAGPPGAPRRMAGPPAAAVCGDGIHVFARDAMGALLHFRWTQRPGWTARMIASADDGRDAPDLRVASDPVAVEAPNGSLHVFARTTDGDLVHCRPTDGIHWVAENLTAGRPTIGEPLRIDGAPVACTGAGRTLFVAGARKRELVLYTWRPDTDWTAEVLTAERAALGERAHIARDPVPLATPDGVCHLFGTDDRGSVVHVELVAERRRTVRALSRPLRWRRRRPAAVVLPPPAARRPVARRRPDEIEPAVELPMLDSPPAYDDGAVTDDSAAASRPAADGLAAARLDLSYAAPHPATRPARPDVSTAVSPEAALEAPLDVPADVSLNIPFDAPLDEPLDAPLDTPIPEPSPDTSPNYGSFDRDPFDRDPFDPASFDPESFDRETFDRDPFDRDAIDRDANDRAPFEQEPFEEEPPGALPLEGLLREDAPLGGEASDDLPFQAPFPEPRRITPRPRPPEPLPELEIEAAPEPETGPEILPEIEPGFQYDFEPDFEPAPAPPSERAQEPAAEPEWEPVLELLPDDALEPDAESEPLLELPESAIVEDPDDEDRDAPYFWSPPV